MKNLLLIFAFLFFVSCVSKKAVGSSSTKETISVEKILEDKQVKEIDAVKNKEGDLIGYINKNAFLKTPYNNWFTINYNDYKPKGEVVKTLNKNLKGISIKGFLGTWCKDSKRETPRFYKILEATDFDFKNLQLIAVNRSKKTPDNLQAKLNIIRVPTFIFFKDGKEIGRYVEYARETLEKDMLKIISEQPYKHSYDKSN